MGTILQATEPDYIRRCPLQVRSIAALVEVITYQFKIKPEVMPTALKEIIFSVVLSAVLVFNIAGNSLVIYIIRNERGMKTSTNYLLLNLAVADLLFGVFLAPEHIVLPLLGRPSLPDGVLGDWLCKLIGFGNIGWVASRASIFTMVCLSVERYFAVCRPHTFRQRFSPKIVKGLIVVSWIYAVVMLSPLLVDAHFSRKYFGCSLNDSIFKGYMLYSLVETTCVLSLMVFSTVKIFISLWCKQTVEPTGEREITERKKKKKITLCVLAVVATFVVCWSPAAINFVLALGSSIQMELAKASVLAASINAALDPYLFSFQSSRFKVLVKKALCCRKESSG
ncbi:somatostatin receptor type 5-like [Actinia tenebrosa]|uniref:Somatostatin receptor type 5-like n=1 Tax=Actinia tenebrosa TaxID=6105 RepID=A0A6P8HA95_ACTTE|nr:somatostatin receptor type 5-like [Actinia tenebrosa]